MKSFTVLAAAITLSAIWSSTAFANEGHGHNAGEAEPAAMMDAGGHDMMRMMMRMHASMMHQNMMGMMAGNGGMPNMLDPMGPMMGMFDADGDGRVATEEAHERLSMMHTSFDVNADGSLSIEEFETLHNTMFRGLTVDRFQHLDADGDGKITAVEMTAPANRLGSMADMPGAMMPEAMMDAEDNNSGDN